MSEGEQFWLSVYIFVMSWNWPFPLRFIVELKKDAYGRNLTVAEISL
jgi:hypothetical protein